MDKIYAYRELPQNFWPVVDPQTTSSTSWYSEIRTWVERKKNQSPPAGRSRPVGSSGPTGSSVIEPIKSILAVGAQHNEKGINAVDFSMIKNAVCICMDNNIPVDSAPDITIMNLNQHGDGDFLKAEGSADLIITCFIFNGFKYDPLTQIFKAGSHDPIFNQSDRHHTKESWHQAAKNFGARAIITYSSSNVEIGPKAFSTPNEQKNTFEICDRREGFLLDNEVELYYTPDLLLRSDLKRALRPSVR